MSSHVVKIAIELGVGLFNTTAPIAALLQNKDVELLVLGGHGAAIASALKVTYPKISTGKTAVVLAHLVLVLGTHIVAAPLVQVLNVAPQRNYKASVRHEAGGPGTQDDRLILYLEA